MPCDRQLKPQQTIQERAEEIRTVVNKIASGLAAGSIKVNIGPQGAIEFVGLSDKERNGVSDNCIYRRLMATGSVTAKLAIAQAERASGRKINDKVIAQGVHAHNGIWHAHKG